ncbi:HNH endonuclease [Sphingomonas sp. MMS12-HWE2-04]|uniref:HNH endonuclease n=1 Tax=Sphingomonas sp. MMS12-HWE2-04 TaxID=3234199 RepID=UPI00384C6DA6
MPSIKKIRDACFCKQEGRCHYCGAPMWRKDPAKFAKTHALSKARARLLQATAEHLKPRCDGGRDEATNIVAACLFCNQHRHKTRTALPPEKFKRKVRKRVAASRWHGVRFI